MIRGHAAAKAKGDALGKATEVPARALPDWFQRLEPGCPRMGVDADAQTNRLTPYEHSENTFAKVVSWIHLAIA